MDLRALVSYHVAKSKASISSSGASTHNYAVNVGLKSLLLAN